MNTFHQMPAPAPAAGAKPQAGQRAADSQSIFKLVVQALQAQGPFTGWREAFPMRDRAFKTMTMCVPTTLTTAYSLSNPQFLSADHASRPSTRHRQLLGYYSSSLFCSSMTT